MCFSGRGGGFAIGNGISLHGDCPCVLHEVPAHVSVIVRSLRRLFPAPGHLNLCHTISTHGAQVSNVDFQGS